MNKWRVASLATLGAAVVLGSGCATVSDQTKQQLASASTSIELAEQSGAREYGAVALDRARHKLAEAQRAADRNDDETALRLAEQAELDAELAASQASHEKTRVALNEINEGIATLRRELQ